MKTNLMMSLALAMALTLGVTSCNDDWGRVDPPAGNQVYPSLQNVSKIAFEDEGGNPLIPENCLLMPGVGGELPDVVVDEKMQLPVLDTKGGTAAFPNPLNTVKCQKGVSFTFWVRQPMEVDADGDPLGKQNVDSPLISFVNDGASSDAESVGAGKVYVTADGTLYIKTNKTDVKYTDTTIADSAYMAPNEWHFMGVTIRDDGYSLYVDSKIACEKVIPEFKDYDIVSFLNKSAQVCIGDNEDAFRAADLTLYRNIMTEKEYKRPKKGSAGSGSGGGAADEIAIPYYFNDFEGGLNGCTIMGGGKLEFKGGSFGTVFSNAMDGMRVNYLKLPEDALSNLPNNALTIAVWVNRGNETASNHYMWSPMFTAYGSEPNPENTWPMLACQYRGVLQFNCATWTDYVDGDNTQGYNAIYHDATDWLADGKWHLYTAVFTPTNAKVYFDGQIVNEWNLNGADAGGSAAGLFTNGADLKHICLGGNQAWNWGDPDPGFWFDDLALYDVELTADQIQGIIELKNATTYVNGFEADSDVEIVGGGIFMGSGAQQYGRIFSNAMDGMRVNYLKLPEDLMTKCANTKEFSMRVWLNRGNETVSGHYMWCPLFMCYGGAPDGGANTWPMFACQYRGVLQFNCATWTDFVDAENVNGINGVYHDATDWLADGKWHLYTVTLEDGGAKVYFDGELKNEWVLSGAEMGGSISGLWTNGADLKYNCLGGNQAWNWGDPDPGFWFDDFAVYNKVLTEEEIQAFYTMKK